MRWQNTRPRVRSRSASAAFVDPARPIRVDKAPEGKNWAHEIKHDGYRIQIHLGASGVRLFTMSGYDWTERYPLIVEAASKIKGSAIIDAEAVIADENGLTNFEAIHGRNRDGEMQAFAFDLMMRNGEDVRDMPWLDRRQLLKQLLGRRKSLVYNREIVGRGPEVYRAACGMGLEGIVSKQGPRHIDRAAPRVG
ncbi:MAG: DNA ligase [Xanthobacteraceae bacterium]|nr:DNA ligase [Xanthobacteraceae bacterium]